MFNALGSDAARWRNRNSADHSCAERTDRGSSKTVARQTLSGSPYLTTPNLLKSELPSHQGWHSCRPTPTRIRTQGRSARG